MHRLNLCLLVTLLAVLCHGHALAQVPDPIAPSTEEVSPELVDGGPAPFLDNPPASGTSEALLIRIRDIGRTPDAISAQLVEAETEADSLFPVGPLTPLHRVWDVSTGRLQELTGLELGLNYTFLYQRASTGVTPPREGAGADLDFFGSWYLPCEWLPSTVVFNTEVRHRYSSIPPASLGDNVGSVWGTTVGFGVEDFTLVQLYLEQGSYEDGILYRVGRMDPALIYDGARYVSSNYAYLSPGFSDTVPMPLPGPGLGVAGAVYPFENTYVVAGFHDANGSRTRAGFDTFFGRGEFFTAVEVGAEPNYGEVGEGLYHATLWYIDPRERASRPSDFGFALTLEQEVGEEGDIVPFLRYAWANRGLLGVRQNASVGVGFEDVLGQNEDLIGTGFSWAQPADLSLRDQYVLEAFYRVVVTPHSHITPDLQVIIDPSMAPDRDAVVVFGFRFRTLY